MPRVKKHDQTPAYITQIGKLMAKAGDSQEDLAAKIGTNRDKVNNWLQDTAPLDADNLLKIARLYGVSTDSILDPSRPETDNPTVAAACGYTGLSVEAIDNIKNLPKKIAEGLLVSGVSSEIALVNSVFMFDAFVKFLASNSLGIFLASLINVSQARDAVKAAIDLGITGAQAGEILEKQRFSLFKLGTQAQIIARGIYGVDRYEEQLASQVLKAENCNAERRKSNG